MPLDFQRIEAVIFQNFQQISFDFRRDVAVLFEAPDYLCTLLLLFGGRGLCLGWKKMAEREGEQEEPGDVSCHLVETVHRIPQRIALS